MGAWDVGNFDNDDAADWVYDLAESEGAGVLTIAFEQALTEGYLEADACCAALAAAEVVAALAGNAGTGLPPEVTKWVAENSAAMEQDLLARSRAAVTRVKEESELRELWQESDDFEQWVSLQEDLMRRLGAG